jgi:hypothetical protein
MKPMQIPYCAAAACAVVLFAARAHGGQLPPDVRAGHWAAPAVTRALQAGLLGVQADKRFHGDAKVTRLEAVMALGKLGHALVEGTWKSGGRSRPVPDSVSAVWETTDWKGEPVRRYTFAVILTRFGDYVSNAVPRPANGANVGKSEILPNVSVKVSSKSPAYGTLMYLASNRMITPDSVLLKADNAPLLGGDLSRALAEVATGVNDRLTDIGKSEDGSVPKGVFQKPAP